MTGPGGGANINASITLNVRQFQQATQDALRSLQSLTQQFQQGQAAQGTYTAAQRRAEQQMSRSLSLYQQLAGITNSYVSTMDKLAKTSGTSAAAQQAMTASLQHMQTALSGVAKTTQAQFAAQSRTLTLYQQMAKVTNTVADTQYKLARAQQANATAANQQALATQRATKSSQGHTTSMSQERYALYEVAAAYGAVGVALGKITLAPITVAAQFEDAFAQVSRVLVNTDADLGTLYSNLESLATVIPTSFEDLAGIESLGAQLGIATSDLTQFTDTVAKFGATTNVSINEAALAFGRISNLLHVPSDDFDKLASSIAYVGSTSAATETEILSVAQGIAGAAGSAGIAAPEVIGLSGALASLKIPPEMARGAITRLFAQFARDAADGSQGLASYAKYLGITTTAAQGLLKTNPGAFFQELIKGIAGAVASGGNLTSILDDLNIKNVRDVNVIQRLVGSYDLLANSVVNANAEYQKGTFLQDAAAARFDTTVQKLKLAQNAIRNFAADTGSLANKTFGAVLLPVLDKVLEVFNAIPSPIRAGALALTAIIAGVAAYRAALALAIAATIAFRQVLASTLGVSGASVVSLGSLMTAIRGTGAAAAGATAQVSGFGRALGFLGGWVGVALTALATVGVAVYSAFQDSNHAAEESAARMADAETAFVSAAGGAESLAAAIKQDSDALDSQNGAFKSGSGILAEYTRTIKDLHNGQAEIIDQWVDAKGKALVGEEATHKIVNYSDSVLNAATSTDSAALATAKLRIQSGLTTDQLERETLAIGKNAAALEAKAIQEQLFAEHQNAQGQTEAPLLDDRARAELEATFTSLGTTLSGAVAKALAGDDSQVQAAFNKLRTDTEARIAKLKDDLAQASSAAAANPYDQQLRDQREVIDRAIKDQEGMLVGWDNVARVLGVASNKTREFAASGEFLSGVLKSLGLDDAANAVDDTADGLDKISTAATKAAPTVEDVATSFGDLVGQMFDVVSLSGDIYAALEKLGKGLATNGTDFSALTENGRANLKNLEDTVNAYGAVLQNAIKTGNLSAEQAAIQMQQYVEQLVQGLASNGVDTSQLDFLVQYVSQIVSQNWTMPIGADISGAIAGLDSVNDYAMATYQAIASLGMSAAATASGANIIEGARMQGYVAPSFVPSFTGASYGGPTTYAGNGGTPVIPAVGDLLDQAKAWQAAQDAATGAGQAASDAGGAAKQAGKDATDAADQAAQAEEKRQQYLKDTAAFYKDIGSSILGTVKSEGDVYSSLQDLGNQIAVTGGNFNTFTEDGRKNFDSLTSVLDAFGATLGQQVQDGLIDSGTAMKQFQQFAGGLRDDLIKAGVPAAQLDDFFKSIGASSTGWANTTDSVSQYRGQVDAAAEASRKFGDAAKAANDAAAEAAKQHLQYVKDLGAAYAAMGTSVFSFANLTGDTFEAIQNLGSSIAQYGTSFNVATDAGRHNFDALTKAIDAFGAVLEARVNAGLITGKEAAKEMAQYAGGLYAELRRLGVPAAEIDAYFKALGIDTKGFKGASAAVAQYAGVLTNAAAAARAAAQGTDDLSIAMKIAEDYANRLGDALNTAYDRIFGLAEAKDGVASAINAMRDSYQEAIDKVKELRSENQKLTTDLMTATADRLKASTLKAIALKYGDTTRAAQYGAQEQDAKQREQAAKDQIAANNKAAAAAAKNKGVLKGNSKEALANRAALRDLQKQMFDQIEAYAKTGATTKQVEKYTADMKDEFLATATSLGFAKGDLKDYTSAFDTYKDVVKNTPRTVTTTVTADTSQADAALSALPDNQKYTIVATADTKKAAADLTALPDEQDYTVTASTSGVQGVINQLGHIPKTGTYALKPQVLHSDVVRALGAIPKVGNYRLDTRVNTSGAAGSGGTGAAKRTIGGIMGAYKPKVSVGVDSSGVKASLQSFFNSYNGFISKLTFGMFQVGTVSTSTLIAGDTRTMTKPAWTGGQVRPGGVGYRLPGYASGGQLPGTPPRNPRVDNLMAVGPNGMFAVRSREWVIQQPSSDYYGPAIMAGINNRQIDRGILGMALGGQVGSGGSSAGGIIVELSPYDRQLLLAAVNRPVVLATRDRAIASSTDRGNMLASNRGGV